MTIDAGHPRREAPMNMGTGGLPIGIGYDDPAPAARMNRFKRMYTMACEEHEAYGKWMASRGLTVEGYRVEIDDGTSAEE